jgi:hypothetical protein
VGWRTERGRGASLARRRREATRSVVGRRQRRQALSIGTRRRPASRGPLSGAVGAFFLHVREHVPPGGLPGRCPRAVTDGGRRNAVAGTPRQFGRAPGKAMGLSFPVRRWTTGALMRGMISPAWQALT